MTALIEWHHHAGAMHPVKRAAILHTRFEMIHPFVDGNGRVGRLLMNMVLMKQGYPPAIIREEDRFAYYDAIEEACINNNYSKIISIVAKSLQKSINAHSRLLSLLTFNRTSNKVIIRDDICSSEAGIFG